MGCFISKSTVVVPMTPPKSIPSPSQPIESQTTLSNVSPPELKKDDEKPREYNKTTTFTQSSFLKVQRLKEIAKQNKAAIERLKENMLFEDSDFRYFTQPLSKDMEIDPTDIDTHIRWLRPNELVSNPTIGIKNIRSDEVKQGNLGDCWFIAALGAVANYPVLYNKVFTEELPLYGFNYKGYVKVRFWQYGEWVDIYIDDKLPTRYSNLIYGQCKTTSNFWVPLLEKAYAKLMGSYENMTGGRSERALIDLTGGIFLTFKAGLINSLPDRYRFEDVLSKKSSLIGCAAIRLHKEGSTSDDDYDGHAYSLLRINVLNVDNKLQRIYTLKNPHGQAKEQSRLKSTDPIWSKLDPDTKAKVLYDGKDILTWMNAENMMRYFSTVDLIYYMPEQNKGGNLFEFTEKWETKAANSISVKSLVKSPHYLLHVKSMETSNQRANSIVNLLQDERVEKTAFGITVYLFRVYNTSNDANKNLVGVVNYKKLPKDLKFYKTREHVSYYSLFSGYYLLVPDVSSFELKELAYLFRVYSNELISVKKLKYDMNDLKFVTSDNQYVNIIILRCAACGKPIESQYVTTSENLSYHPECKKSIGLCDFCNKPINGTFYNMENGMSYCVSCYQIHETRINSAKTKYTEK